MKPAAKERIFRIGRARDCDILLDHSSVSRYHAELSYLDNGKLYLTDCHSSNGTAIVARDGEIPVRQTLVSPTQTLRFGDVVLEVKEILEAIRLRTLPPEAVESAGTTAETADGDETPKSRSWVRGLRLIRCRCGEVRRAESTCPVCGDGP